MIRVMRQILPSNAKITDEAKETIQECISKFINYISEEANEIRKVEQRKVPEGKDDYIQALRMRLFRPIAVRPGAAIVPPPIMADPYFYPCEGVGIGGGGHDEYIGQG
ncbi:nuclear transcription factor Y subunit B-6-like [Chenopodium quinoa]|uniref:nuclear transcription factor Y subunit B-6-like n=1 Tax=Chenopodium quinoa TaxID=63459 RepID=UPI000B79A1D9|nr:nuclear transcription factor Y subunit B-6-like [Chenopodium quinoa]